MELYDLKNSSRRQGSILVEALVAIGVTSIGLIGIMNLLTFSFRTNAIATQDLVATYLAAEGVEVVKNIVDTAYADIGAAIALGTTPSVWNRDIADGNYEVQFNTISLSGTGLGSGILSTRPLAFDAERGIYRYRMAGDNFLDTPFTRTISLEVMDNIDCDTNRDDVVRVISRVEWMTAQGETRGVQLEDHFFDWREESETPSSRKPKTCI